MLAPWLSGGRIALAATPKTAQSRRTLRLATMALQALRERKVVQAAERLRAGDVSEDHGPVFTTAIGRRSQGWPGTTARRRPRSSTVTSSGRSSPPAPRSWTGCSA